MKLYMFWTVPLSIIRSFSLYTAMVYVIQVCRQLASRSRMFHPDPPQQLSANLYDIYHCCVQWKTPDDGQRNCPKHAEFHSKNKFEKFVHPVGFIIRNCHNSCSILKPTLPLWPIPRNKQHGGNCRSLTRNQPTRQMLINTHGMKTWRQLTQTILQNCYTTFSQHVWKLLYYAHIPQ